MTAFLISLLQNVINYAKQLLQWCKHQQLRQITNLNMAKPHFCLLHLWALIFNDQYRCYRSVTITITFGSLSIQGRGMCYPVCGMVHIKEPLLLIDNSSLCGGSGFPFSLSELSLTICLTPYNHRKNVLSASLNKTFLSLSHFLSSLHEQLPQTSHPQTERLHIHRPAPEN